MNNQQRAYSHPANQSTNRQSAYKPLVAQTLAERQQYTRQMCEHLSFTGVISHVTALDLWGVERPERFMDEESIHIMVSKDKSRKQIIPQTQIHWWSSLRKRHTVRLRNGLLLLRPEPTWALMATTLEIGELVEVAESMIRHARTTEQGFRNFIENESWYGKKLCRRALNLIVPGSDSPKETQLRLCLQSFGLPDLQVNYRVPGIVSDNGGAVTLDLAHPELKIGIEYQGDHHRTEKLQWRRDTTKKRQLEAMGWSIMPVTQLDLSSEQNRAALAMSIAMVFAQKTGTPITLTTPQPLHRLADRRRKRNAL